MNNKKIVLSGIQPTGVFTLGNYIGAVSNWKELQKNYKCIFFIANMHSITTVNDANKLKDLTLKMVALLIACGIDVKKHILFVQSDVLQHASLSWILQCNTKFSELERMTQFKDKSKKYHTNVTCGLFCYPVLMAADILLYNPDIIPVGKDQLQHLELTKMIAKKFNSLYGETFKIPKPYIQKVGCSIMSLSDPTKKMSKSDQNKNSFISILDTPEIILEKFKKAVTDSDSKIIFDENKPGISNLISIYSHFSKTSIVDVEEKFKNTSYKDFKIAVAEIVSSNLKPISERYYDLLKEKDFLIKISKDGAQRANDISKSFLEKIYEKIGFKYY